MKNELPPPPSSAPARSPADLIARMHKALEDWNDGSDFGRSALVSLIPDWINELEALRVGVPAPLPDPASVASAGRAVPQEIAKLIEKWRKRAHADVSLGLEASELLRDSADELEAAVGSRLPPPDKGEYIERAAAIRIAEQIPARTHSSLTARDLMAALPVYGGSRLPPPPQEETSKGSDWGLANVYTIARRRLRQLPDGHSEREWWQHVVRIAEEAGVRQPGVLRHSVPTEITEGGAGDANE